eukprot:4839387-Pyramimonas_sp.AAC.1
MVRRLGSARSTPFIGDLNIVPEERRKKREKVAPAGFRAAWKRHVRGNLPSVSSLELIQNALRTVTTMPDVDDEIAVDHGEPLDPLPEGSIPSLTAGL